MKKTAITIVTMLAMIGSAQAMPALGGAIQFVASHGLAAYAATHSEYTRECESQPNVVAAHKGNEDGYSFEVTACDFQANKERLERQ